jgi:hypothetical protein
MSPVREVAVATDEWRRNGEELQMLRWRRPRHSGELNWTRVELANYTRGAVGSTTAERDAWCGSMGNRLDGLARARVTSTNKLKACGTFNFSLAVSVIKRQ